MKKKPLGLQQQIQELLGLPSPKKVEEIKIQSDTTSNSQLDRKIRKAVCEQQEESKVSQKENGTFVAALETKVFNQWRSSCLPRKLTIPSEAKFKSHLRGIRHKATCEEAMKTNKQTFAPLASTANESHQPTEQPEKGTTKDFTDKMTQDGSSNGNTKNIVMTHLKENVEGQQQKPNLVTLFCDICNVHCPSEIVMASHLKASRHQKKMQKTDPKKLYDAACLRFFFFFFTEYHQKTSVAKSKFHDVATRNSSVKRNKVLPFYSRSVMFERVPPKKMFANTL